jgi:hypothetical protein
MSNSGIRVVGGDPHVVASDDLVWAADRPVLHLADGSDVPLRLTVVARHEGGYLGIEHIHLSAGSPNEQTLNQELTI